MRPRNFVSETQCGQQKLSNLDSQKSDKDSLNGQDIPISGERWGKRKVLNI